jgi:hypothetical protein
MGERGRLPAPAGMSLSGSVVAKSVPQFQPTHQPAIDSRKNAVNSEQNARAPPACELAVLQCPAISP